MLSNGLLYSCLPPITGAYYKLYLPVSATSARDVVVKNPDDPQPSSRRQWGGAPGTVLKALQGIDLAESPDSTLSGTSDTPQSPEKATPTPTPTGHIKGDTITIKSAGTK